MLAKILEMQRSQIKENTKQAKRRPLFPKKEKTSSFPKEMKKQSLFALNEMLMKQKQETQMSAVGPFQEIPNFPKIDLQIKSSLKIDPSMQVMQLYHKMVETLIHIDREGIQETTFFLDAESSSIFQGAKITITEYNTAPKVFNIHFSANPQGLQAFEAHAQELLNALQNGHFGFGIHRLDTSLLTEDEKHALPPVQRDLEKDEGSPQ